MAGLGEFGLNEVEADFEKQGGGYKDLPNGEYVVMIVKSKLKETENEKGIVFKKGLNLVLEVVDGEHKGSQFFDYINLVNPSATAVKIGKERLKLYSMAVGVKNPNDTQDLHDLPFVVYGQQKKGKGDYADKSSFVVMKVLKKGMTSGVVEDKKEESQPW